MSEPAIASRRLFTIDFWRGLSLVIIFVDHFPTNPVRRVTITGISFTDAAAVFFFLSGFVSFLAFSSLLRREGWNALIRRLARRIGMLYLAHVVTVFGALALLNFYYRGPLDLAPPMWSSGTTEAWIVAHPWQELSRSLLLNSQLSLCNIFPLYILFLSCVPLALFLLQRSYWLLLFLSGGIWITMNGLSFFTGSVPSLPVNDNALYPLAWQFVFFTAFVLAHIYRSGEITWGRLRPPFAIAGTLAALLVAGVEIQNQAALYGGAASGPLDPAFNNKRMAAPTYLLSFALFLILVRHFLPTNADVARLPGSEAIRRLGRNSLLVWTIGILGCHVVLILSRTVMMEGTPRHIFQLVASLLYFMALTRILALFPSPISDRRTDLVRPATQSDEAPICPTG